MSERMVFINIGWMVHYDGPSASDPTLGGHGHLKSHSSGYEAWNFRPYRGAMFGYVPRSAQINIGKLGASKNEAFIDGVTVVWIARNPRNKKNYIVGWYRDAIVYREKDHREINRSSDALVGYQIESASVNAKLLAVDARVFPIPTAKAKGNLGQSPVWYGRDDEFRNKVFEYINAKKIPNKIITSPKQPDPELRRKIEKAAIDHAKAYYASPDGGSFEINSVELEAKGWDLEAISRSGELLRIEVKGLSGSQIVVELTPNEYAGMKLYKDSYIVYILTDSLHEECVSHIFRFDSGLSTPKKPIWISDDGRILKIKDLTAARISVG